MIRYPEKNGRFNTNAETKDFIAFATNHLDDAEALFNLIDKLFPVYNELHPEKSAEINLQTFLYGFADTVLHGMAQDEEETK